MKEGKTNEGKLKVLVVNDDRRTVKTICDILRVKGLEAVGMMKRRAVLAEK